MSLINDALKKAQNLQPRSAGATATFPRPNTPVTGASESAAAPAATAPAPAAAELPPRKSASPHSALIITIASVVLLAGVGAIGYVVYALFFMGTPEEKAVASVNRPAVVKPAKAPAPSIATPPSAATDNSPPEISPTPTTPAATSAAKSAPAPAGARPRVAPVVTSTPPPPPAPPPAPAPAPNPDVSAPVSVAATTPSTTPAPTPAPVAEEPEERINHPKPHIQAWVDKITVSGIRPGDRPKALMNDRVFVIGDVVNRELGLQLLKISDRLLVFEDEEGNTYDYTF